MNGARWLILALALVVLPDTLAARDRGNWGGDWGRMMRGGDKQEGPEELQGLALEFEELAASEDPLDRELAVLGLLGQEVQQNKQAVRAEVMASETVQAAGETYEAATKAYEDAWAANPVIAEQEAVVSVLRKRQREIRRPQNRDRDAWRKYGTQMREVYHEAEQARREQARVLDEDDTLKNLKTAQREASLAFLAAIRTALDEHEGYQALLAEEKQLVERMKTLEREKRMERMRQREAERERRRAEEEEAEAAENQEEEGKAEAVF